MSVGDILKLSVQTGTSQEITHEGHRRRGKPSRKKAG